MPIEILMPALSPTMTEGNLVKWHKQEGQSVKAGEVLAEIETDKATMEVEAVDEGTLGKILVPAGAQGVKVNAVIAVLLREGEDKSALASAAPAAAAPAALPPVAASKAPVQVPAPPPAAGGRIAASPLARRLAAQARIDLAAIKGSGPHGRIVKADVEAARRSHAPMAAVVRSEADGGLPAYRLVPHSTMRRVIARRLTEAKQTVPHYYLSIDCRIDALLKMREELNGRSDEKAGDSYKISVNDFIIKAAALALRKVPAVNASWSEEGMLLYDVVDISVAVAIPNGLIAPIVKNADHKGLAAIANEMKTLAARAREGKLMPEEFEGGTFSISNLGSYGVRNFAAVINPPQGCILAVGAGEKRPVVKDNALAIATVMSCTLSVDHRAVDGAVGAEFLAAFKKLIEDPIAMLL